MTTEIPPEVSEVAGRLLAELRTLVNDRLLALYVFGSSTTGAFEPGISDVDTVAVVASDPTEEDVTTLAGMHKRLALEMPAWDDRIEVDYLSARALEEFRAHPWPAARISPGEPFHRIAVDHRWVLDWYQVRTSGLALYGPSPDELVPAISEAECVQAVREQAAEWPNRISDNPSPRGLAYAVLTICRALRACTTGEYVSKKEAANWASHQLPEFRAVIEDAVAWRYTQAPKIARPPDPDAARSLSEAVLQRCSGLL
jgi:Domain of unknown function (DUF4111)/Nucleotidyltransferase domain